MIAFGCSIIMPDVYERRAKPGIERSVEPDSVVFAHAACGPIARGYNLMLDRAARLEGLEALVVVHQDAEILDGGFCSKLRQAFADPDVALVGCVGAVGARGIAWWDGKVRWPSADYHYGEFGGGHLVPRLDYGESGSNGEVDTLYGVVLAFSPWVVQNLRFDESIGLLHGYDFDICRQARAAGRKVVVADLGIAHHHSLDIVNQVEIWVAAHMRAAELFEPASAESDSNGRYWKERARRAEADAAAARLLAASKLLQADASAQHYANRLTELLGSRSWRVTEPLRRGNSLLRTLRGRAAQS